MFNLKDKTQLDQVQIISESRYTKVSNSDHMGWGLGSEEAVKRQNATESQQKASTSKGNQFRVRIYNVY
ncbi:MAG: hypothetical protein ABI690_09195 [Chloroflexota bacterium]